jgi:hypothetical protein
MFFVYLGITGVFFGVYAAAFENNNLLPFSQWWANTALNTAYTLVSFIFYISLRRTGEVLLNYSHRIEELQARISPLVNEIMASADIYKPSTRFSRALNRIGLYGVEKCMRLLIAFLSLLSIGLIFRPLFDNISPEVLSVSIAAGAAFATLLAILILLDAFLSDEF